jgi:hypothetical protein
MNPAIQVCRYSDTQIYTAFVNVTGKRYFRISWNIILQILEGIPN